jgi:hypothetical protein
MKKSLAVILSIMFLMFSSVCSAVELRENEKAINADETSRQNPAPLDSMVFAGVIEENGIIYILCLRLEKAEVKENNLLLHFSGGFSKTRPEEDIELFLMSEDFSLVSAGGAVVADMSDAVMFEDDTDDEYYGQEISGYPNSTFNIKVVFSDCANYADSALLRYQSAFLSIMYLYQPKVIAQNTAWFAIK